MDRFINARVRLIRASGGRCFGGWVIGANGDAFIVELSSDVQLSPGESVRLTAVCGDSQAEMDTTLLAKQGRKAAFAVPGFIRMAGRTQLPRFRSKDARVTLVTGKGVFRAEEVDVSGGGFGFHCCSALEVGDKAKIIYRSDDFEGTFEVECRHCTTVAGSGYHIGVRLISSDRALQGRWMRYVNNLDAAS